jgi:hypothetical protein
MLGGCWGLLVCWRHVLRDASPGMNFAHIWPSFPKSECMLAASVFLPSFRSRLAPIPPFCFNTILIFSFPSLFPSLLSGVSLLLSFPLRNSLS